MHPFSLNTAAPLIERIAHCYLPIWTTPSGSRLPSFLPVLFSSSYVVNGLIIFDMSVLLGWSPSTTYRILGAPHCVLSSEGKRFGTIVYKLCTSLIFQDEDINLLLIKKKKLCFHGLVFHKPFLGCQLGINDFEVFVWKWGLKGSWTFKCRCDYVASAAVANQPAAELERCQEACPPPYWRQNSDWHSLLLLLWLRRKWAFSRLIYHHLYVRSRRPCSLTKYTICAVCRCERWVCSRKATMTDELV